MDILDVYLPNHAARYALVAIVIAAGTPTIHQLDHPHQSPRH